MTFVIIVDFSYNLKSISRVGKSVVDMITVANGRNTWQPFDNNCFDRYIQSVSDQQEQLEAAPRRPHRGIGVSESWNTRRHKVNEALLLMLLRR